MSSSVFPVNPRSKNVTPFIRPQIMTKLRINIKLLFSLFFTLCSHPNPRHSMFNPPIRQQPLYIRCILLEEMGIYRFLCSLLLSSSAKRTMTNWIRTTMPIHRPSSHHHPLIPSVSIHCVESWFVLRREYSSTPRANMREGEAVFMKKEMSKQTQTH